MKWLGNDIIRLENASWVMSNLPEKVLKVIYSRYSANIGMLRCFVDLQWQLSSPISKNLLSDYNMGLTWYMLGVAYNRGVYAEWWLVHAGRPGALLKAYCLNLNNMRGSKYYEAHGSTVSHKGEMTRYTYSMSVNSDWVLHYIHDEGVALLVYCATDPKLAQIVWNWWWKMCWWSGKRMMFAIVQCRPQCSFAWGDDDCQIPALGIHYIG